MQLWVWPTYLKELLNPQNTTRSNLLHTPKTKLLPSPWHSEGTTIHSMKVLRQFFVANFCSLQICFPILHPDAPVWHLVAINCEIHLKFQTKIFLLTFSVPVRLLQLITCSTKQSLLNQGAQMRVYIWCKWCGGKKCEHVHLWTACRSTHVWCHKAVASCC